MRALLGDAVIGGIATWLAFAGVHRVLSGHPRHLKENYRGATLVATGGVVLIVPVAVGAARALAASAGVPVEAVVTAGAALVLAILGFVDDVYGSRRAGGLVGHARELLAGRLTTGIVKAVGGAIAGLVAAALLGHRGAWIVVAGAVVALGANMANLLDLRPARTAKVFVPLAIALLWAAGGPAEPVLAAVVGGAVVFAYYELREVVMLGDVGSNLLGAALGTAAVSALGRTGIAIAATVLLACTLLAERFSFTRIIGAVAPLRWLDELGRTKA